MSRPAGASAVRCPPPRWPLHGGEAPVGRFAWRMGLWLVPAGVVGLVVALVFDL